MSIPLKQSTASQEIPLGMFVDSTNGNDEETGLTIANTDIKLWKAGATTLANKNSGGATHISNGIYYAVLDATDTDTLGPLVVFVHVSGALPVRVQCVVLAANVYDSLVAASDKLQVDTVEISGTTQTARDIGASVLLSSGTGTGQLSLSSGTVTLTDASLTAAKIGADAFTAAKFAADVTTEFQSGLATASSLTSVASDVTAILADTNELQTDWADGGRLDLILDARASQSSVNTIDDFLDTEIADISSRLPAALVGGRIDANVGAISSDSTAADNAEAFFDGTGYAGTGNVIPTVTAVTTVNGLAANTVTASALATDAVNEIADGLLNRDMSTGTDSGTETVRTPRQALRFLRNKWSISGTTLTVTKENDTDASWTGTVTTNASADPITATDPSSS